MDWVVDFLGVLSKTEAAPAFQILAQPFLISRRPSPGSNNNNKGGQFSSAGKPSFVGFMYPRVPILEPVVHGLEEGRFRERVELCWQLLAVYLSPPAW